MSVTEVPIRPASTLVLARGDGPAEVLLVLRGGGHGFLANMWVFPGGRVDEADGGDELGARRAAMRETWEEAGILLAAEVRTAAPREAREAGAIEGATWPMACFARWVTPRGERRRYDTRFYVARVPWIEAVPDLGEVTHARWLTPAAALALHREAALPMAPPTYWTLEALSRLETAAAMIAWAEERERVGFGAIETTLAFDRGAMIVASDPEALPLPKGEPVSGRLRLVRGVWVKDP